LLLISFEFPHLRPFLFLAGIVSGRHGCAGAADQVILGAEGGKCCCAVVCLGGDAESLVHKVALLVGELVEAH
jgi:hypothetical protein